MAFFMMAALIACGDTKDGDTADGGGDAVDTELVAEAEAAFAGYESWEQIAPYEGIQPGESVHGSFVQIWYNDIAAETINAAAGAPLPVGSTIVKESYTDEAGSDLINQTVMYKASDEYGWFWGTWDGGENVISGQPSTCTDCHVAGQDYNLALTW